MDDRHRKRIETLINQTIKREMQELGKRISDHTRASLVREQKEKREAADRGQPVDWSAYAFWNNSRVYMLRASWMREAAEAFIKATGDEIYATSSGADAGAMFRDGAARMLSELDGMVAKYRKDTAPFGPGQADKLEHYWKQERPDAEAAEEIAFLRFDDEQASHPSGTDEYGIPLAEKSHELGLVQKTDKTYASLAHRAAQLVRTGKANTLHDAAEQLVVVAGDELRTSLGRIVEPKTIVTNIDTTAKRMYHAKTGIKHAGH